MKILPLFLFSFLFGFAGPAGAQTAQSLREAYLNAMDSLLGGEFDFQCGWDIYKFKRSMMGIPSVKWKKELTWVDMENVQTQEAGFTFEGLSLNKGVRLSQSNIKTKIDFPGIVPGSEYGREKKPIDYFDINVDDEGRDIQMAFDAYSSSMSISNIRPMSVSFSLRSEEYLRDKKTWGLDPTSEIEGYEEMLKSNSNIPEVRKIFLGEIEELRKKQKEVDDEKRELSETIKGYLKPMVVLIAPGDYSKETSCHTLE